MELKPVYLFIIAFIVITIGIATLQTSSQNIEQTDLYSNDTSSNFTSTSLANTLSPVGEGITSNSIQVYNQTWLNFDGVNDYVNLGLAPQLNVNGTPFSICGWNNLKNNTIPQLIYSKYNAGSGTVELGARDDGGLHYQFLIRNSSSAGWVGDYANIAVINNTWQFVCGVYDNNTATSYIYLNGELTDTAPSASGGMNTLQNLTIGMRRTGDNPTNGSIEDLRAFNKTLTQEEIYSLYYQGQHVVGDACDEGYYVNSIINEVVSCSPFPEIDISNSGNDLFVIESNATDIQVKINLCNGKCRVVIPAGNYAINQTINLTSNLTLEIRPNAILYAETGFIPMGILDQLGDTFKTTMYANDVENLEIINYGLIQLQKINTISYIYPAYVNNSRNIRIMGGKLIGNTTHGGFHVYNSENIELYNVSSHLVNSPFGGECNQYINVHDIVGNASILWEGESYDSNSNEKYLTITNIQWSGGNYDIDEVIDVTSAQYVSIKDIYTNNSYKIVNFKQPGGNRHGICANLTPYTNIATNLTCENCNRSSITTVDNSYIRANVTDNSEYFNNSLQLQNRLLWLRFNENTGTTAYDSSGNSNHGTISGATWQNDGILVTLSEGVDYTLNTASGLLTLSEDYLYSWVSVGWVYNYRTTTQNVSMARLVGIFIVLAILGFIMLIINYYVKEIRS